MNLYYATDITYTIELFIWVQKLHFPLNVQCFAITMNKSQGQTSKLNIKQDYANNKLFEKFNHLHGRVACMPVFRS